MRSAVLVFLALASVAVAAPASSVHERRTDGTVGIINHVGRPLPITIEARTVSVDVKASKGNGEFEVQISAKLNTALIGHKDFVAAFVGRHLEAAVTISNAIAHRLVLAGIIKAGDNFDSFVNQFLTAITASLEQAKDDATADISALVAKGAFDGAIDIGLAKEVAETIQTEVAAALGRVGLAGVVHGVHALVGGALNGVHGVVGGAHGIVDGALDGALDVATGIPTLTGDVFITTLATSISAIDGVKTLFSNKVDDIHAGVKSISLIITEVLEHSGKAILTQALLISIVQHIQTKLQQIAEGGWAGVVDPSATIAEVVNFAILAAGVSEESVKGLKGKIVAALSDLHLAKPVSDAINTVHDAKDQVKDTVTKKVSETTGAVVEKVDGAKETVEEVTQKASSVKDSAAEKVEGGEKTEDAATY